MRVFGIQFEENTPGGFPAMWCLAAILLPVFALAWAVGYALIDWVELIRLTEEQSRNGYRDVFRLFVGLGVLGVTALLLTFRETIRRL